MGRQEFRSQYSTQSEYTYGIRNRIIANTPFKELYLDVSEYKVF